jgi:predicted dehydrogenase
LTIWKHEGKRDWWAPMSASSNAHEASDPLINQIKYFAEVIHGQAQPLVSGREGLHTLAVIEAIQLAAETNQTIQITDQHGKIRLVGLKTDTNQSPPTKPHLTQSAQF